MAMLGDAHWEVLLLRLGAGTLVGLLLGLEREWSGHDAGLRTHALVALSSATITLSALMLFDSVKAQGGAADPVRVIQGLAQSIGFIAGGLIFIRGGDVRNMTTAASLWMAAGAGIVAGAGQYPLLGIATALAMLLLLVDRLIPHRRLHRDGEVDAPSRRGATKVTPRAEPDDTAP
jgi:putative Mg2+ transporter-C (MgtC) family protein